MRFLGTGSAVPDAVLTNDMLAAMVDTSDEWIRARSGIEERRIAKDESTRDLALAAAKAACDDAVLQAGITYDQIGVVICATVSNEDRCPSLACYLQRDLGFREEIFAFDLNAACSGFIYALIVASRFVSENEYALIVGCEVLSHIVDFTDRGTCILFGDGAGAAVIAPESDTSNENFFWVTEACGDDETLSITDVIRMDGTAVFKFAVEVVVRTVKKVAAKAHVELEEIDIFILHQANERIIKSAAKRLGVPMSKFFMNLSKYGNTSAASIPLAFDEAIKEGAVERGSKIIMAGFGGGLTAGAVCFTWT